MTEFIPGRLYYPSFAYDFYNIRGYSIHDATLFICLRHPFLDDEGVLVHRMVPVSALERFFISEFSADQYSHDAALELHEDFCSSEALLLSLDTREKMEAYIFDHFANILDEMPGHFTRSNDPSYGFKMVRDLGAAFDAMAEAAAHESSFASSNDEITPFQEKLPVLRKLFVAMNSVFEPILSLADPPSQCPPALPEI